MKKKNIQLKMYEQACHNLMLKFLTDYYCDKDIDLEDLEPHWIADEPGGVLSVQDEFHGMDNIVDAMRYKPTRKQFFDFYEYELDCATKEIPQNYKMRSFIGFKLAFENGKLIYPPKP